MLSMIRPTPRRSRSSTIRRRSVVLLASLSGLQATSVSPRRTKRRASLSRSRSATAETCSEKISSHPAALRSRIWASKPGLLIAGRCSRVAYQNARHRRPPAYRMIQGQSDRRASQNAIRTYMVGDRGWLHVSHGTTPVIGGHFLPEHQGELAGTTPRTTRNIMGKDRGPSGNPTR